MDVLFAYNRRGFLHAVTCDTSVAFSAAFEATMHAQGCRIERLTMTEYRTLRDLDQPVKPAPPARLPLPYSGSRTLRLAIRRQMALAPAWAAQKKALATLPPWTEPENVIDDPLCSEHVHRWNVPAQDSAAGLAARRQLAAHLLFGRPLASWGQRWADLQQEAELERARFERSEPSAVEPVSPALPNIGLDVLAPHIGRGMVVTHFTLPDGVRVALVRGRNGEALARPDEWEAAPAQPAPVAASPPPPAPPDPAPLPPPRTVRPATTMPSLFGDWS